MFTSISGSCKLLQLRNKSPHGTLLEKMGKLGEAEKKYMKAIELAPEDANTCTVHWAPVPNYTVKQSFLFKHVSWRNYDFKLARLRIGKNGQSRGSREEVSESDRARSGEGNKVCKPFSLQASALISYSCKLQLLRN